jgi:hypothetical protein
VRFTARSGNATSESPSPRFDALNDAHRVQKRRPKEPGFVPPFTGKDYEVGSGDGSDFSPAQRALAPRVQRDTPEL